MNEVKKIGWICLDIDGTITDEIESIPNAVLQYLRKLHERGWNLVFVTGRTFSLAHKPLINLGVPYYLVPQNGASIFKMPEKKMLYKNYLPLETFLELEKLIEGQKFDFVLFGGADQDEPCYYRPEKLKKEVLDYFQKNLSKLACHWIPVETFSSLKEDSFPYGKIYGSSQDLLGLEPYLKKEKKIKVHLVKDAVHPSFYILQVMDKNVDKGKAVMKLMDHTAMQLPIISAGNDTNDEALLQIADVKIAIKGSPKSLLDLATIVSDTPKELGIIPALTLAEKQVIG